MTWPCAGSKEIWKNISPFFSKNEMNFEFFYHADAGSLFTILSHSQLLILLQYLSTTTPYTPLCLARHPSKVYYWKLSIAHKMYCWEIFWKPISRSLFLIGLPYWKIEGHTCVRRLLWFPNWFTWHFISTWKDEKLFCGKKNKHLAHFSRKTHHQFKLKLRSII